MRNPGNGGSSLCPLHPLTPTKLLLLAPLALLCKMCNVPASASNEHAPMQQPAGYQDARQQHYKSNGPTFLGILIPLLLICSIISCCISYRRHQQAYLGQELSPMPPNFYGGHPNAPGYGQQGAYPMAQPMGQPMYGQPMYGQNQGMSAGTGAALGATGGFLGGMMLANAMDGGHGHGGYGGGGAPQQDMGGGAQDMGADMGFGE
jgi:hypothetical protein